MGCPKCQCEEISPTGMCLWCGHQLDTPDAEPESNPEQTESFPEIAADEAVHAASPPVDERMPEWRQQLSDRLQSIKQKREAPGETEAASSEQSPTAAPESRALSSALPSKEPPGSPPQDSEELIDNKTSSRAHPHIFPAREGESIFQTGRAPEYDRDPMILLARSLSGVVDLIIMFLCTGAIILAADIFEGIKILDLVSILHYSALFLLVYFLYSLFFLGVSGQTIGMMMTGLRLATNHSGEQPRFSSIVARTSTYLLSVLCLGAGLIWAVFDREHRCSHDKLTNTRVLRA